MYAFNTDSKSDCSHSLVTSHLPQIENQRQFMQGPLALSLPPPTSLLFLHPLLVLHLRTAHCSSLCLEALPDIYMTHCHTFPAPAQIRGLPSMTILPIKYPHQSSDPVSFSSIPCITIGHCSLSVSTGGPGYCLNHSSIPSG